MFQPSTFCWRLLKHPVPVHLCADVHYLPWRFCLEDVDHFLLWGGWEPKKCIIVRVSNTFWDSSNKPSETCPRHTQPSAFCVFASVSSPCQTGTDLGCLEGWPELVGFQSWGWCRGNQGPTDPQPPLKGGLWHMRFLDNFKFLESRSVTKIMVV